MNINLLSAKKLKIIIGLVGIYLVAAGGTYLVFSQLRIGSSILSPSGVEQKRSSIDTSAPKTEECPLNGKKYTKAEKDIWVGRRPLGIMIENHEDSRPQSGLSSADVVYEAVAEGGITRFLALFYCGASAKEVQVGPVRSARIYYMDWISEYGNDPVYVHVGGANKPGPADALGAVKRYGWELYNDLNQFGAGFPTFWKDPERLENVATEHTTYSTTDKLWKYAQGERGLTDKGKDGKKWDASFIPWKFTDGASASGSTKISFPFMGGYDVYKVVWDYDASSNEYRRTNGGKAHKDFNNEAQIIASNVVVEFTKVKGPIDELKHLLYDTTGSGKALIFQNGSVVEGTWSKGTRSARTKFLNKQGKEISFVRGPIWIEVLDSSTKVEY